MEKKKHTDREIILGLSCCSEIGKCTVCPYYINKFSCNHKTLMSEAVDLIQTLKEEVTDADGEISVARDLSKA